LVGTYQLVSALATYFINANQKFAKQSGQQPQQQQHGG
jgi:hypothetical protein